MTPASTANNAMPPITPPTIAPVGGLLWLAGEVEEVGELDDVDDLDSVSLSQHIFHCCTQ